MSEIIRGRFFEGNAGNPAAEVSQMLVEASSVRIERIVSRGQSSPDGFWYDQEWDEWVLLLAGAARLHFEGAVDELDLVPGDYVWIPAHRRHRVSWTDPHQDCIWLAVHFPS